VVQVVTTAFKFTRPRKSARPTCACSAPTTWRGTWVAFEFVREDPTTPLYTPGLPRIGCFLRSSGAAILLASWLLGGTPLVAIAGECPADTLYIVESKLCIDSTSQAAVDPSCCAKLEVAATNRDGSPKRMKLPKQCPAAPISYVKQTGTCISNHKAIDLACCDAIPR
jgi:hypothetical protein